MAFPSKTIAASAHTPAPERAAHPPRSALVTRLARPGIDPAKRSIRERLLRLSDAQLQAGLGLSQADIAALRAAGRNDAPAVAERPALAHPTRRLKRLRRLLPTPKVPAVLQPRAAKAEAVPRRASSG